MKKGIISWSLIFLLFASLLPAAYGAQSNLGTATVNEYYSCTVYAPGLGHTLSVAEGSALPDGFSIDGNMLSGTPTESGEYSFDVTDGENVMHCYLSVGAAEDPAQVSSIAVNTAPTKLEYTVGSQLDTAGLLIDVIYAGGSSETISTGFGYYPVQLDTAGVIPIEVSYRGCKCYFNVTVSDEASQIGGIGLVTLPAKTEYKLGDEFVPSGIVVRVYRLDKSHYDIDSGYSYSPDVLNSLGEQTITLTYEGKSCTFTVNVSRDDVPSALYVATHPAKTSYVVGEGLDTTGLTLSLMMSSGAVQTVTSGFVCTPAVLTAAGVQSITVSYGGFTCSYNVTVSSSSPSPSPSPSPTPTASAGPTATPLVSAVPSPSATPHGVEYGPHATGAGTAVLKVVLIAAILLLAALGVFVCVAKLGGVQAAKARLRRLLARFKKK